MFVIKEAEPMINNPREVVIMVDDFLSSAPVGGPYDVADLLNFSYNDNPFSALEKYILDYLGKNGVNAAVAVFETECCIRLVKHRYQAPEYLFVNLPLAFRQFLADFGAYE